MTQTQTKTHNATPTTGEPDSRPSATILPFPLNRTPSWLLIADQYACRPDKGRNCKAAYAQQVIESNIARLRGFGVAPEHIEPEIGRLRALFCRLDGAADDDRVRA